MSYYKILGMAVLSLVIITVLKRFKEEYACLVSLTAGLSLTLIALEILSPVTQYLKDFCRHDGTYQVMKLMFKSCGISVISTIGADLCRDLGEGSLGDRLEMCAKALILALSLPLLISVLDGVKSFAG